MFSVTWLLGSLVGATSLSFMMMFVFTDNVYDIIH